jgi:hypothetical protein
MMDELGFESVEEAIHRGIVEALDRQSFSRLSKTYGIKYFVIDKAERPQFPLKVAYQNTSYAIGYVEDSP